MKKFHDYFYSNIIKKLKIDKKTNERILEIYFKNVDILNQFLDIL